MKFFSFLLLFSEAEVIRSKIGVVNKVLDRFSIMIFYNIGFIF